MTVSSEPACGLRSDVQRESGGVRKRYLHESDFTARVSRAQRVAAADGGAALPRVLEVDDTSRSILFEDAGEPLATYVSSKGRLEERELLRLFAHYAASLASLHASDLVHGDIRRSKLHVRRGAGAEARGVLVDRASSPSPSPWSAPNVLAGAGPTGRIDDVFALTACFSEVALGLRPRAVAAGRWARAVHSGEVPDLVAHIGPRLREVVEMALTFRVPDGAALVRLIDAVTSRGNTLRPPAPFVSAPPEPPRSRLWPFLLGAAAAAAGFSYARPDILFAAAFVIPGLPPPAPRDVAAPAKDADPGLLAVTSTERDPRRIALDAAATSCWIDHSLDGDPSPTSIRCAKLGGPVRTLIPSVAATHLAMGNQSVFALEQTLAGAVVIRQGRFDGRPGVRLDIESKRPARGFGVVGDTWYVAFPDRVVSAEREVAVPSVGFEVMGLTVADGAFAYTECSSIGAALVVVDGEERRRHDLPRCPTAFAMAKDAIVATVPRSDAVDEVLRIAPHRDPIVLGLTETASKVAVAPDRVAVLTRSGQVWTLAIDSAAPWKVPFDLAIGGAQRNILGVASRGENGRDGGVFLVGYERSGK